MKEIKKAFSNLETIIAKEMSLNRVFVGNQQFLDALTAAQTAYDKVNGNLRFETQNNMESVLGLLKDIEKKYKGARYSKTKADFLQPFEHAKALLRKVNQDLRRVE